MNRSAMAAPTSTTATSSTMPMLPPRCKRSTDGREDPLRSCVAIPPLDWLLDVSLNADRIVFLQVPQTPIRRKGRRRRPLDNPPAPACKRPAIPPSARRRTAQPHHVADHLGDCLVVFGRDLGIDRDGGVQGA